MKRLFLTVSLGVALFSVNAQTASPELVSSAGESFNNTSYQLDWSIGEGITATHSAGDYVITQGLHQGSYVITSVEDLALDINISVYPNPTTDLINLTSFQNLTGLAVIVTNINGKILQQTEVINKVEQLNFSDYENGIYFLTIKQKNQLIKSFKIIKN